MLKLTIGNSECKLEGMDTSDTSIVKEMLSYIIPQQGFYSGKWKNNKRTLLGRDGTFPTGLLYIVESYLKNKTHRIDDIRREPKPIEAIFKGMIGPTPYIEQKAAAQAAKRFKRGIISSPTGTGKSVMICLLIEKLKVPTLIVVPNLALKIQLLSCLKASFPNDLVGDTVGNSLLTVCNVDSLDTTKSLKGYDCVIIDEFHHSGAKTYRKLNKRCWNNVYYKFGFTATPFRSMDSERLLLESVLSKIIYKVDYDTSVKKGYIVPVEAYFISIPKKPTVLGIKWPQVYGELVVNNNHRNLIINELLLKLHNNKISTICLVKEIKHGEILTNEGAFNFIKGENEDNDDLLQKFNNKKFNILIGTTGVIGEGVDTKPAEYIIIAGLGKSKNQFMQQVGRGVRRFAEKESCKVILFKDSSHKWTSNHFKEQCKILLEEYQVIPQEIKLDL